MTSAPTSIEERVRGELPCTNPGGGCNTLQPLHYYPCPASFRPAIVALVKRLVAEENEACAEIAERYTLQPIGTRAAPSRLLIKAIRARREETSK